MVNCKYSPAMFIYCWCDLRGHAGRWKIFSFVLTTLSVKVQNWKDLVQLLQYCFVMTLLLLRLYGDINAFHISALVSFKIAHAPSCCFNLASFHVYVHVHVHTCIYVCMCVLQFNWDFLLFYTLEYWFISNQHIICPIN